MLKGHGCIVDGNDDYNALSQQTLSQRQTTEFVIEMDAIQNLKFSTANSMKIFPRIKKVIISDMTPAAINRTNFDKPPDILVCCWESILLEHCYMSDEFSDILAQMITKLIANILPIL